MLRINIQYLEKYEEIAIITASAEDGWTQDHKIQLAMKTLKKRAAKLGTNGVVITDSESSFGSANFRSVGNM